MGQTETSSSPVDASSFHYVVGIDIGSQTCSFCTLKPDWMPVPLPECCSVVKLVGAMFQQS